MKKLFIPLVFVLSFSGAVGQQWEWAKRIGAWCDQPSLVSTNNSGDVISAMVFNWNNQDYCHLTKVTKRSNSGQIIWTKTIGAINQWTTARSLHVDNFNNVFVLGFLILVYHLQILPFMQQV